MPYFCNTPEERQAMLDAIGVGSIEELFAAIPENVRLNGPLDLPRALTEMEMGDHIRSLAAANGAMFHLPGENEDDPGLNVPFADGGICFLGAGAYDHFIPAVVDDIASRPEFYTSYTPYQPEVAQGNLQALFEYQTMICELTGMDVSNASLYDGGGAVVESALMSLALVRKATKIVTSEAVHPVYLQMLRTYFADIEAELVVVPAPGGVTDLEALARQTDDQTACVITQSPNFFGCVEQVEKASEIAHEAGALSVNVFDPIGLGLLKKPGDQGVDIAVAEGQSLGVPLCYGGPYLGIMACREKFVRRMPGRIAGQTTDRRDRRCWVLTLQTREQHIRREKATSNICTNQGLMALRACVYLALAGPQGLRETATLCLKKAAYAKERITASDRFEVAFEGPTFKEFVIRDRQGKVDELLLATRRQGIFAGVPLGQWLPEMNDCFLVAVTERRTREEIDRLAAVLSQE